MDFFPLQVDYEEKMYAVGKIPGSFKRREGRASDKAILTARLIDRPLRPLFPKGLFNDVVIVAQAVSVEPDITPEPLAMIGSSVALAISDIPWAGPTGSVVVGLVDGTDTPYDVPVNTLRELGETMYAAREETGQ